MRKKGWILYKRGEKELTAHDHGVNRFLSESISRGIDFSVYKPADLVPVISSKAPLHILDVNGNPLPFPDFVLPRIGAETGIQALALLSLLEKAGIFVVNTVPAIERAKNKFSTILLLKENKLAHPKTMLLDFSIDFNIVSREIGFPLVVKSLAGARGEGVFLCETMSEFRDLWGCLSHGNDDRYLAQEFITESAGKDLRVFVIDGKPIACILRTAKEGFKANYSLGGSVETYPMNQEIKALSVLVAKIMNLHVSGIDLLFSNDGFLICEANSSPGFKGLELATGKNIAGMILDFVLKKLRS